MLRSRVEAALRLGARLADPVYVPTGAVGRHPPAEAEVMAGLLMRAGVPGEKIWREETGTDTLSSARACARLLRRHGFAETVWACSSGFHLLRCVALLRLAGLPVRFCPPPEPGPQRWYWRLREAAALPYDLALALSLRIAGRM